MGIAHEVEWKQLTLGHLSRNKFWGEDPDTQYHSVVASSTLVRDGDINILVDPTLPVDEMENRLQRYCGLCCFSKRMRKVFRKNEKSMLQNCNKKAKRKGRLQRVKKPM